MNPSAGSRPTYAVPESLRKLGLAGLVVGVVAALACAVGASGDPTQFFRSYLVGWVFVLAFPLGCLGLLMIQHLTGGDWGVIIRRVLEASTRTLPFFLILSVPLLLWGMPKIYPWVAGGEAAALLHADEAGAADAGHGTAMSHGEESAAGEAAGHDEAAGHGETAAHGAEAAHADPVLAHKAPYLNVPFFQLRTLLYFVLWIGFAWVLNRLSAKQDEAADPMLVKRMQAVSAIGLIVYVLSASFASYDWLMSLAPHWYSTMYGVYFVGTHGIAALSFLILTALYLSRTEPMSQVLAPRHFHDWGKLLLAFVVLWAYFSISQFLIIWSGNLPEEISWYLPRFSHGWLVVATGLLLFHFGLPFALLLSRDLKRHAGRLAWVAAWMLAARWVDLVWQVVPTFHADGFAVSWMDVAAPLAVGGIWFAFFVQQLSRRSLLPVNDPYLEEALIHGH